MTVGDIYRFLDSRFPFSTACDFDNVGILVGDESANVTKCVIALDCTRDVLKTARDIGAELIITHHPVIFAPLKSVSTDSLVAQLLRSGISVISAHTNLDMGKNGVNDALLKKLEVQNIRPLVCSDGFVIRTGVLENELSPEEFARYCGSKLGVTPRYTVGKSSVKKIAVCSGGGGEFLPDAVRCGADAYLTGEAKHHIFLQAIDSGITLVECGHFPTEDVVIEPLCEELSSEFSQIKFITDHSCNIKF